MTATEAKSKLEQEGDLPLTITHGGHSYKALEMSKDLPLAAEEPDDAKDSPVVADTVAASA